VPRLIINADDFGLTLGVNRAIAEAAAATRLTSATIMANSARFDEAVQLSRNLPGLKTGCHVVLIDGEPLAREVNSLIDHQQSQDKPRFRSNLKQFALAALRRKISQEEIQREAELQIRKIQATGITVTHVDTHKHTHLFPHVLLPVIRAAQACGVTAIRNPFEPRRTWPTSLLMSSPGLWTRTIEVALLRSFASSFVRTVRQEGMRTTEGAVGVIVTGSLDQKLLNAIIRKLPEGTWELVCHPGYCDDELRGAGTRLLNARQVELDVLTSAETSLALAERRIKLISFADLEQL
jgi:predicted glycoside hydrolase/deacetylase ChbG (UPF0249 family)